MNTEQRDQDAEDDSVELVAITHHDPPSTPASLLARGNAVPSISVSVGSVIHDQLGHVNQSDRAADQLEADEHRQRSGTACTYQPVCLQILSDATGASPIASHTVTYGNGIEATQSVAALDLSLGRGSEEDKLRCQAAMDLRKGAWISVRIPWTTAAAAGPSGINHDGSGWIQGAAAAIRVHRVATRASHVSPR